MEENIKTQGIIVVAIIYILPFLLIRDSRQLTYKQQKTGGRGEANIKKPQLDMCVYPIEFHSRLKAF